MIALSVMNLFTSGFTDSHKSDCREISHAKGICCHRLVVRAFHVQAVIVSIQKLQFIFPRLLNVVQIYMI